MKKFIAALALVVLTAGAASALEINKVGFGAYSSATKASCSVVGGVQGTAGFIPSTTTTRVFSLGTKGLANYSTAILKGKGNAVKITCFKTADGQAYAAKVFFNGASTKYATVSDWLLSVSR